MRARLVAQYAEINRILIKRGTITDEEMRKAAKRLVRLKGMIAGIEERLRQDGWGPASWDKNSIFRAEVDDDSR